MSPKKNEKEKALINIMSKIPCVTRPRPIILRVGKRALKTVVRTGQEFHPKTKGYFFPSGVL